MMQKLALARCTTKFTTSIGLNGVNCQKSEWALINLCSPVRDLVLSLSGNNPMGNKCGRRLKVGGCGLIGRILLKNNLISNCKSLSKVGMGLYVSMCLFADEYNTYIASANDNNYMPMQQLHHKLSSILAVVFEGIFESY